MKYALKNPESRLVLQSGRVITSGDVLSSEDYNSVCSIIQYDEKQKPQTVLNEALSSQFKELPDDESKKGKAEQAKA